VGAERGAGGGVEAAFEEGAEDGGVDGAPVHVGGGAVQGLQVGGGEGGTSMVLNRPPLNQAMSWSP
jgi:hypothetical protein